MSNIVLLRTMRFSHSLLDHSTLENGTMLRMPCLGACVKQSQKSNVYSTYFVAPAACVCIVAMYLSLHPVAIVSLVKSFGDIDLILIDLFHWLAISDHVWLALEVDHDLGGFGEGVVVLGAHARAVGTTSVHDEQVSDFGLSQASFCQIFWLTRLRGHQIPTFAAMPDDDDVFGFRSDLVGLTGSGEDGHRVDGSVKRRTKDVGHSRIEFQKGVASVSGCENLVLDGRDQGSAHGYQVGSGLDFQFQFTSAVLFGELTEGVRDGSPDFLQVSGDFALDASDLVSTSQVQGFDGRPDLAERQGFRGDLLPNGWVATGSDVRVDSFDDQAVLGDNVGDGAVLEQGVPDSERRSRPTDVCLRKSGSRRGKSTGTGSRVDTDTDLLSGSFEGLSDAFDLRHGASVDLDAQLDEIGKVFWKFLCTKTDVFGWDTGFHGTFDLETRRCVDVNALRREEFEDGGVGAGLHGVSDGQSVRVGEGQTGIGRFLEFLKRIGKDGAPGEVRAGLSGFGGQKDGCICRSRGFDGSRQGCQNYSSLMSGGKGIDGRQCGDCDGGDGCGKTHV
mmetsp:Transcript_26938/g.59385  ORF Transcript_26938/g.59385 Transcript_26938/m.59385 type:complete len:559 (-) Transcript_26938:202-1878(-)